MFLVTEPRAMTTGELRVAMLMASLYEASMTPRYRGLQVDRFGRTASMNGRRARVVGVDEQGSVEVMLSQRLVRCENDAHANTEILRYLSPGRT